MVSALQTRQYTTRNNENQAGNGVTQRVQHELWKTPKLPSRQRTVVHPKQREW